MLLTLTFYLHDIFTYVEFLLLAFLKRLYSITYFNKITFNVSTPHLHFWSQIHTNNISFKAQSNRYGKIVWMNFSFNSNSIIWSELWLIMLQSCFLKKNHYFLIILFTCYSVINYSKDPSHIFDFSFIYTQHKQHFRRLTIYGHKWLNKIAAVIRHRRHLPDIKIKYLKK